MKIFGLAIRFDKKTMFIVLAAVVVAAAIAGAVLLACRPGKDLAASAVQSGGTARQSAPQTGASQPSPSGASPYDIQTQPSESRGVLHAEATPSDDAAQETHEQDEKTADTDKEAAKDKEDTEVQAAEKDKEDTKDEEAAKAAEKKDEEKKKTTDWDKIISQFEVEAKKYYNDTRYSSNHYEYTKDELKMLATVIYLEARNQPYKCKVAVGNVVMNRVLARGYPGSDIESVVTRKNQFCYSASTSPNTECMRVARDILDFEVWTVPQNTYFFRANKSKSDWGSHDYFTHYGNTAFYRDTYSGRYNGKTIPQSLYERTFRWPQYGCKPASRVRKVQRMLKGLGYKVTADGYFGMDTKKALVKFQKSRNLKADGIAGPATIKALIRKYGVDKYGKL